MILKENGELKYTKEEKAKMLRRELDYIEKEIAFARLYNPSAIYLKRVIHISIFIDICCVAAYYFQKISSMLCCFFIFISILIVLILKQQRQKIIRYINQMAVIDLKVLNFLPQSMEDIKYNLVPVKALMMGTNYIGTFYVPYETRQNLKIGDLFSLPVRKKDKEN